MSKFTKKQLATNSGMKAVCFAVSCVAQEHAADTKDHQVRSFCAALYRLAEGCADCIDADQPFTIILSTQMELPLFELPHEDDLNED